MKNDLLNNISRQISLKMKGSLTFLSIFFGLFLVVACETEVHKARYDYYGLYRFHLETQEHVELFQEIEEKSDSYTFYGHALNPDQNLSVVVAPNKIAEIDELCNRFGIKYTILVSNFQKNYHFIT